jgi:alkaline phosphatase D
MDTRAERSNEQLVDGPEKTMLGLQQKDALFEWLGRVNETATFKFLISSVPFNSLWGKPDGHKDTWAGYRHERNEIMDVLEFVPNVVVLSGDRHEHLAVQLRETVTEFSTSPLSQFYVPVSPRPRTS